MNVGGTRSQLRRDCGEGQVVRGDQPNRAALEQFAQHADRANEPIVRIRPVEQLVEQKEERSL